MKRTLTIDGIEIDIPEDAYVEIKQFSHIGSNKDHLEDLAKLPEKFSGANGAMSGTYSWMERETEDEKTEWTVFLT